MKVLTECSVPFVIFFVVGLVYAPFVVLAADEEHPVVPINQDYYRTVDFTELKKDAESGNTNAMFGLGLCYAKGAGGFKDEIKAVKWYRKAADLGHAGAMTCLGGCYQFGEGISRDKSEAIKWYRKAVELGDAEAMFILGVCSANGEGVVKNEVEAVKWYRKTADLGNTAAMCALGGCYFRGAGVNKNEAEAVKWYRKAADLGDAEAMSKLGGCYYLGTGVSKELTQALNWWRKSANLGNADAMFGLATCYTSGEGVPANRAEATKWYRKAAEIGDAGAMEMLRSFEGTDHISDAILSVIRLTEEAEKGDTKAMIALGRLYSTGGAIPKDEANAFKWYRKAAEAGDEVAIFHLGSCYENGVGVPQDDVYAYAWFSLASAKNSAYAQRRDKIRRRMTPEQVAEAQKLATAYSENKGQASGVMPNGFVAKKTTPFTTATGFFVTTDGYLLTAYHVVAKSSKVKVSTNGKSFEAKVVRLDRANDIVLLKADGSFTALAVVPSRGVKLGAEVFSVGFPNIDIQGTAPKLTKGSVNALSGIQDDPRAFQINVPIQPGNSGGPLLDSSGNIVGVVVSQLDAVKTALITGSLPQGVNYAVKSAYVQPLLDSIPDTSPLATAAKSRSFDDAVKAAEAAVCIVLAYD